MKKVWYHQIWIQNYLGFHCVRPNIHMYLGKYNEMRAFCGCWQCLLKGLLLSGASGIVTTLIETIITGKLLYQFITYFGIFLCHLHVLNFLKQNSLLLSILYNLIKEVVYTLLFICLLHLLPIYKFVTLCHLWRKSLSRFLHLPRCTIK